MTGRRLPGARLGVLAATVAALSACASATGEPEGSVEAGRALLGQYGCVACHQVPGVAGPQGRVGPPLGTIAERRTVAGTLPNTPDNLRSWIQDPQEINPGSLMPDVGVTDDDVDDIVAYLYSLESP
ncbi:MULTISPECIES: c-type cytochrome [unclassified Modestobacter]